jgi:hypothetical protein
MKTIPEFCIVTTLFAQPNSYTVCGLFYIAHGLLCRGRRLGNSACRRGASESIDQRGFWSLSFFIPSGIGFCGDLLQQGGEIVRMF